MPIQSLNPNIVKNVLNSAKAAGSSKADSGSEVSFQDMLSQLSGSQYTTDNLIQKFAAGGDVDVHEIMIAAEQTDVNFQVALAIRDQLVDAYREVMRMNV